ncbi:MAG TPA: xanthine dehydrogenase accessory protein XdhC [Thiolinea sp.]|nr:xanthine dehydrogenase accessory protein XdhC [Thiolinea sp.]
MHTFPPVRLPPWWPEALQSIQQQAAILVRVQAVQGSAPRAPGSFMLVFPQHAFGSIGGGRLEYEAMQQARTLLHTALPGTRPRQQAFILGPDLAQCCGGAVRLEHIRIDNAGQLRQQLQEGPPGQQAVPPPLLILYGAGHVGRAIVQVMAPLPWQIHWIDSRPDHFPPYPPSHVTCLENPDPTASVAQAPANAWYLVMTHDHGIDLALCQVILTRADFAFLGLIGSRTKAARFRHRLRDAGIAGHLIEHLTCPVGLPGISGKEPEIIAIAVAAQLLKLKEERA